MTQNASGFGLQLRIVATTTFPVGFTVTQLADDVDPFDIPSIQVADKAMGVNGDLIVWAKATPISITVGAIPNSEDDTNLGILLEANRPARGKFPANDRITLTGIYPDGKVITLAGGAITDGMIGNALASAGRLKSKPYIFTFENVVKAP